jgi:hypothetical protein
MLLVVGAGNITSVALTGTGRWLGWPVLIAAQLTFAVYGAITSQQQLWLLNVGMVAFAVIMWRRWHRLGQAGRPAPGRAPDPVDEFPSSWADQG